MIKAHINYDNKYKKETKSDIIIAERYIILSEVIKRLCEQNENVENIEIYHVENI